MSKAREYGVKVVLLSAFLLSSLSAPLTSAQVSDPEWSEPLRLSSEDGAFVHLSNNIVSDSYGLTHVLWLEEGLPDGRSVIQYTRFDGETWSLPLDIFATQPGGTLAALSADIDRTDTLHLIWTQGGTFRARPILYSRAASLKASSINNWSKPVRIEIVADLIKLQVDTHGIIHILYSSESSQPGVYYIRSNDQGKNWSNPVWLDPDIPSGHIPYSLNFELDDADGLHAVWYYRSIIEDGRNDWVRYSHSLDGGDTWSPPFTIDKDAQMTGRLDFAGPVMIAAGLAIYVIWAAGDLPYRYYILSTDAGQTWSASKRIFGVLHGQAVDGLTVDGAGRVHFFGQIRWPMGIYHAYLGQQGWSVPSLIYLMRFSSEEARGGYLNVHGVQPAVRAGNQLVVTFYDRSDEHPFALYEMHSTLSDVPSVSVAPTPISTPSSSATPVSNPIAPTQRSLKPKISADKMLEIASPSPSASLFSGILPVLLLLVSVFVFFILRKR